MSLLNCEVVSTTLPQAPVLGFASVAILEVVEAPDALAAVLKDFPSPLIPAADESPTSAPAQIS